MNHILAFAIGSVISNIIVTIFAVEECESKEDKIIQVLFGIILFFGAYIVGQAVLFLFSLLGV